MPKIIFIVGPTAVGKTDLSIALAQEIKGEIVSCDSMVVYKEPAILTAKPAEELLKVIPHHCLNLVSVTETFNVFDYYSQAVEKINQLYNKNIPIIVCGGSGLYVKAILNGIFTGAGCDLVLRLRLENKIKAEGTENLYNELKKIDSAAAEKISPNDSKRIIRALEVYYTTGVLFSEKKKEAKGIYDKFPIKIFGLNLSRDKLYQRINQRVDMMIEQGAILEVENLRKLKLSLTAEKIIGIKEITNLLDTTWTKDMAIEEMKKNTRRFAKRQLTWFRADKRIQWIDIDNLTKDDILTTIKIHGNS